MRFTAPLAFLLVLAALAAGCRRGAGGTYDLDPTPDATDPGRIYIPADVEDAVRELERAAPPALLAQLRATPEGELVGKYHMSLGRWIRDEWGLWSGSRLQTHMLRIGARHPDAMSSIILTSFWRHLHGQPLRVDEQVRENDAAAKPAEPQGG